MGKQINFYMTNDDEQKFVAFVHTTGNVAVFKAVQASLKILELRELPHHTEPFWFSLCLWNKDFCPPPELTYIEAQGYYCVEETESEVIQFHRSGVDEGRLVRGRIWAEMSYWWFENNPPNIVKKSEAFVKWFNRLVNWIKRHSTRDERGEYMLPGAAEFKKQGGILVQAVFDRRVKLIHHKIQDNDTDTSHS